MLTGCSKAVILCSDNLVIQAKKVLPGWQDFLHIVTFDVLPDSESAFHLLYIVKFLPCKELHLHILHLPVCRLK